MSEEERVAKRDKVSKAMGDLLLQGWTMLQESCDDCNVPLMRNKKQEMVCVGCDKWFVKRQGGAIVQMEAKKGEATKKEPEVQPTVAANLPQNIPPLASVAPLGETKEDEGKVEQYAYDYSQYHNAYMNQYYPHESQVAYQQEEPSAWAKECFGRIVDISNIEINLIEKTIIPSLIKKMEEYMQNPIFDLKIKEHMEIVDKMMHKIRFYTHSVNQRILALASIPKQSIPSLIL